MHNGSIHLRLGAPGEIGILASSPNLSQSYRVTSDDPRLCLARADGWARQQLPEALGQCYCEHLALSEDLLLVRSRYLPTRQLIEETRPSHGCAMLVITFGLQGDSGYRSSDGAHLAFRARHTTVSAFQHSQGERCYQAGDSVAQLRLLVSERLLGTYLGAATAGELLGNGQLRQLAFQRTSAASSSLAHSLFGGLQPVATASLDRHIHCLSLLSEQLRYLAPAAPRSSPQFSAQDLEKLERVREIMLAQLDQPLTVAYLCAAVGLNEFKLKSGLRYRFDATPQRMLLELRMRHAYRLLENGCQVAQAGYQVGYRFPNNFSVAFSRFFGQSPKSVFGKRR